MAGRSGIGVLVTGFSRVGALKKHAPLVFTVTWYYPMGDIPYTFKRGHALNSIFTLFSSSCTPLGTVDIHGRKCVLGLKVLNLRLGSFEGAYRLTWTTSHSSGEASLRPYLSPKARWNNLLHVYICLFFLTFPFPSIFFLICSIFYTFPWFFWPDISTICLGGVHSCSSCPHAGETTV